MLEPVAATLADGRLHLQHGPIDLLVGIDAASPVAAVGYRAAAARFPDILPQLAGELPALRTAVGEAYPLLAGPVARRMARAAWPHREVFVTPMAAVAGAVADEILAEIVSVGPVRRAHVNNGGDIAFHLAPGERYRAGLVTDIDHPSLDGFADLAASQGVAGVATSGWRGRSHSLGIADAVTVLAADAASADIAATLIANATNTDDPAIERRPARELMPDSDLGDRLVTVGVGPLADAQVVEAIAAGQAAAMAMWRRGLVHGAIVALAGRVAVIGEVPAPELTRSVS
ncbi:MAG: UPF0280 family protein [Alphaproteobacteria bacterium]